MPDKTKISILLPCKNSAYCLEESVNRLLAFFERRPEYEWEIILIPNKGNSSHDDGTEALSYKLAAHHPTLVKAIPHGFPYGKGAALRTGFHASTGKWLFFMDSDCPYSFDFIDKAIALFHQENDLITGNRRLKESIFECPVPLLKLVYRRNKIGIAFNRVARFILGIKSTDTQCGIKAMTRGFAEDVFARQSSPGFLFDLEYFMTAAGRNYKAEQVPVRFFLSSEVSTIHLFYEFFNSIYWFYRLFLNRIFGKYSKPTQEIYRPSITRRVLTNQWRADFFNWIFLVLRWGLTPYHKILKNIPGKGTILDMGAGHGLLSMLVALEKSGTQVIGFDHDHERIAGAKKASWEMINLLFFEGDLETCFKKETSCILLIDVLHYYPFDKQKELIAKAFENLLPGGTLLIRELDSEKGFLSKWNAFYEMWAVKSGFTKAATSDYSRKPSDWFRLLSQIGFKVSTEPCSGFLFADRLFVCKKPELDHSLESKTSNPFYITADDWGMSPSINLAILELAQKGIIRRVSMMAKAPYVELYLKELLEVSELQLGLHFDLTSQWSRLAREVEGFSNTPMGLAKYLVNPKISFSEKKRFLYSEAEDQLTHLHKIGVPIVYLDSHHHVHLIPGVFESILPALTRHEIKSIRIISDNRLWTTSKFILNILGWRLAKKAKAEKMDFLPFLYPQNKDLGDTEALSSLIKSHPGHEILFHPSHGEDFVSIGCQDTYEGPRVLEYFQLKSLTLG